MSGKFCTRCGASVGAGSFCTSCGAAYTGPGAAGEEAHEPGVENPRTNGEPSLESGGVATAVRVEAEPTAPPARGGPLAGAAPTKRSWLPYAVSAAVVAALLAIGAVILIALGGSPSNQAKSLKTQSTRLTDALLAGRQLYVPTQQASYSTLLPAGWRQIGTSNSDLVNAITVQSPVDSGATITVGQVAHPSKTLSAEGARLLSTASNLPSFQRDASTGLTLSGGRQAWELAYQARGTSNAYYVVRSCNNTYAVSASVPPARVSLLRQRIAIVAATLQGNC